MHTSEHNVSRRQKRASAHWSVWSLLGCFGTARGSGQGQMWQAPSGCILSQFCVRLDCSKQSQGWRSYHNHCESCSTDCENCGRAGDVAGYLGAWIATSSVRIWPLPCRPVRMPLWAALCALRHGESLLVWVGPEFMEVRMPLWAAPCVLVRRMPLWAALCVVVDVRLTECMWKEKARLMRSRVGVGSFGRKFD